MFRKRIICKDCSQANIFNVVKTESKPPLRDFSVVRFKIGNRKKERFKENRLIETNSELTPPKKRLKNE